jgi:hypothetical protein
MLHMLQVFQRHVASVWSKYFIYFPYVCCNIFFIWMMYMFHTYVATICSKCFSCFSLILQQVVFMLQVASGWFVCFTHMLQVRVSNVSSTFRCVCCIQIFFMLQVFHILWPRTSRGERIGRATRMRGRWMRPLGPADGGVAVRAHWGRSSSAAHPGL